MPDDHVFRIRSWGETEDPVAIVAELLGGSATAAIGNRTWAQFLVALQRARPATTFTTGSDIVGPLREVKDPHEIEALRRAAAAVDRIAAELQAGAIPLVGRTEAEVSADLGPPHPRRGPPAGELRHRGGRRERGQSRTTSPGPRVIAPGEVVLCDFGGTMPAEGGAGYCSDITRCVVTGEPTAEMAEVYSVLHEAQAAAVAAGHVGTPAERVDAAARDIIADAGYGDRFVHRTGHGIGVEEHEDPYIVIGQPASAGRRQRLLRRARHLPARPLRLPARGHRRGHRARPRRTQPCRPPPGRRGCLSSEPLPSPMIDLDAASVLLQWATGGLFFLLDHDPPTRGLARLRLDAPRHVLPDGGRRGLRRHLRHRSVAGPRHRVGRRGARLRRGAGVIDRPAQGRRVRSGGAGRVAHRSGRGHDRHRPRGGREGRRRQGVRPPRSTSSRRSSA